MTFLFTGIKIRKYLAHAMNVLFALLMLAVPASTVNAAQNQNYLGIIQVRGTKISTSSENLTYHNAQVMKTNETFAIFWIPPGYTVSPEYVNLINRYFSDVAAASGSTTNVYYSVTQYYDTETGSPQFIQYSSTFGGFYVDTTPFYPNGCSDKYTTVCLSDAQIQSEVQKAIFMNNWPIQPTSAFFLLTPQDVGSCADGLCTYSDYCGYHSWLITATSPIVYAHIPYAGWSANHLTCDSGQHPNGDVADAAINAISHLHNEMITDLQNSAWHDSADRQDGDKCVWNFGTGLGSTANGQYNQLINGNPYYLQQEWSNRSSKCVLQGQ
ncbi:MAG: hypothetical protein ACM3PY_15000 [Omnitrophica WOR_2 bacterium]